MRENLEKQLKETEEKEKQLQHEKDKEVGVSEEQPETTGMAPPVEAPKDTAAAEPLEEQLTVPGDPVLGTQHESVVNVVESQVEQGMETPKPKRVNQSPVCPSPTSTAWESMEANYEPKDAAPKFVPPTPDNQLGLLNSLEHYEEKYGVPMPKPFATPTRSAKQQVERTTPDTKSYMRSRDVREPLTPTEIERSPVNVDDYPMLTPSPQHSELSETSLEDSW